MEEWEEEISERIKEFSNRIKKNLDALSAEKLVNTSAINPVLVKALGLSLEDTARFFVYQRIQRSVVTSFGSDMEFIVKRAMGGKRGVWWDVVKKTKDVDYFVSVKSGPSDMDKDQVDHFAQKAKAEMEKNPKAYPIIGMAYGKNLWGVIGKTLLNNGLDPTKHAIFGKKLYNQLTNDPQHYKKLLAAVERGEQKVFGNKTIIEVIEDKVKTITSDFRKKYKDIDELLEDTW